MKECDKNQDGKIDFNEFFNAMIQWNIIKIIVRAYSFTISNYIFIYYQNYISLLMLYKK